MDSDDELEKGLRGHMEQLLAKIRARGRKPPRPESGPVDASASRAEARVVAVPRPGMVIRGAWELLAPLGKGSFGTVFEARHLTLDRLDAIKFLHPHLADDEGIRERFHIEAKTMARLRGEHLVQVHDYGMHGPLPFFVMERLTGEPLHALIIREAPLPSSAFFRTAQGILRGLAEIHAHGVIHRDVKPANVFVEGASGRVKILDFGLAKTSLHVTSRDLKIGTPVYMAPELLLSADARPSTSTDIYAAGVVLYEMLTRRLPFHFDPRGGIMGFVQQLLVATPQRPSPVEDAALRAAGALVLQAIDRDPDRRPESAAAFVEALSEAERSGRHEPSPRRSVPPVPSRAPAPKLRLPHLDAVSSYFYVSFSHHDEATTQRVAMLAYDHNLLLWIGDGGRGRPAVPAREAIEGALGVVVIASPESKRASNVAEDVELARALDKPVVAVWARGDPWHDCIDARARAARRVDARDVDDETLGDELVRMLLDATRRVLPMHFTVGPASAPSSPRDDVQQWLEARRPLPPGYLFVEDARAPTGGRGLCLQLAAFRSVRQVLDDVYLSLLAGSLPPFSYGERWMLAQAPEAVYPIAPRAAAPWWWPGRRVLGKTGLEQWANATTPTAVGMQGRWQVVHASDELALTTVAADEPRFFDIAANLKAWGFWQPKEEPLFEARAWESFREADHYETRCYAHPMAKQIGVGDRVIVQTRALPRAFSEPEHRKLSLRELREWMLADIRCDSEP